MWQEKGPTSFHTSNEKREFDLMNISENSSHQLGWFEGDEYVLSPSAEDILEELLEGASKEGGCWKLNRANFLKKDLIPFFTRVEDEPKVFAHCSKLLLLLTQPLECFVGGGSASAGVAFHTKEMLRDAKEAVYKNPSVIKSMFREMNAILDLCGNFAPSKEDVDVINNCLLILRNILHFNEEDKKPHHDYIFQTLFKEGFEDLYKRLVAIGGCRHWTVSIVQLLSLLFKDAPSVSLMIELTIKDEHDLDKNPQFINYAHKMRGDTIKEENGDDEDDDADEDDVVPDVRAMCGESTDMDDAELDEMDRIQVDDKVMRRLNGNCSEQDLNRALASFGVTIMQHGFKDLVANLLTYLTDSSSLFLDDSYLTWLLSYFLKFVFLPEMTYGLVEEALSVDTVNFLIYQTIKSVEEFACEQIGDANQTLSLRKVHLCVMALREVFHSLNYVSNCMKLSKDDEAKLQENLLKIASLEDLRHLFMLLIRTCPLAAPYKIYLRDIITTNHVYLLLVEQLLSKSAPDVVQFSAKFNMLEHVRMFAEKSIVSAYGYLLENYAQNSPCLNDCIMTMLHHVSGDCNRPESLLQIPILSTFMEIYESEFPLPRESFELVEYILSKFEASCKEEDKSKSTKGEASDASEHDMAENDSGVSEETLTEDDKIELDRSSCSSGSGMDMDCIVPEHRGTSKTKDQYPFLNQLLINVSAGYVATIRRVSPTCRLGLDWVSESLFEACYAKLKMRKNEDVDHLEEPVAYFANHYGISMPIVPFTVEQNKLLSDPLFVSLLRQLGFHLHEGKLAVFPRIPSMWGPEKLHRMGQFLSQQKPAKYSEEDVLATEESMLKTSTRAMMVRSCRS